MEKYMNLDQKHPLKSLRSRLILPHPYLAQASGMFPEGHPRKMIASYFFFYNTDLDYNIRPSDSTDELVTPLLRSVMIPLKQYNNQSGTSRVILKQRYSKLAPEMYITNWDIK